MSISSNDVTIKLSHSIDHRGEYKAFRAVTAEIQVRGVNAGSLSAVIIDRKRIPEPEFLSAMDGHSSELQMISAFLFEPQWARTRVQSIKDGGDDYKLPFMYIESMHVEDVYKEGGQYSDVGTYALHQLLNDPYVLKRKVTSCYYILDPTEAMTRQEKEQYERSRFGHYDAVETEESNRVKEEEEQRMNQYARIDANPYLRNGFYQDEAVAALPDNSARILIAAHNHWNQPLKSHGTVAAVQLLVAARLPEPVGRDAEILELTKRMCEGSSMGSSASSDALSQQLFKFTMNLRNETRASAYRTAVSLHIEKGGSLVRSNALHAACANNDPTIVQCILDMDSSTISARDLGNSTALMVAATSAAGRCNISGCPMDQPVIDILLAAGADKNAVDSKGLTAYGLFLSTEKKYSQFTQAMCGRFIHVPGLGVLPGYAELRAKLMPRDGPTRADQTGGDSEVPGFIHYGEEKKRKKRG